MAGAAPGGSSAGTWDAVDDCGDLCDPARMRALEQLGLSSYSDGRMEEFAVWVREALAVPIALVSIVRPDAQVFPGMSGLPQPWAGRRSTPLTYSFCRHVVRTAEPLVITDAREHPLVRDSLAVPALGVVAYAGMPLPDERGHVLGSLCAIDTVPRRWTPGELTTLRRIAQASATDLRLRLAHHDAEREELRRDRTEAAQRRSFERSQTLLLAAQAFTDTVSVDDVLTRIRDLVRSRLRPSYVGAVVVGDGPGSHRLDDDPVALAPTHSPGLDRYLPSARAIREAAIVHHPDRASFDAENPPEAHAIMRHLGLHSIVAVPLPGADGPLGAIVLGWEMPNAIDADDLLTLATVGGYASQALTRARLLDHRIAVARELQNAMLTTLPDVAGLEMAARYEPADSRENVGGDWYDAVPVTDPGHPGRVVIVTVGDILGHTLNAATIMGQVRSMLRQTAWERPAGPPSAIVEAFEGASSGLHLDAAGTAVLARLAQEPSGSWTMTWTNAGHPPPVVVGPDGDAELLTEHGALFGLCPGRPRSDLRRVLAPGSTLFLYTDGLVERRGRDIDVGIDALVGLLCAVRHRPVREVVDLAVRTLAPDAPDDVVAFAIRFLPSL